jgi:sulfide:quinone oxidoreductase
VNIELVSPERQFRYRPLAVGEPFGLSREEHLDLGKLASYRGVRHSLDAVTAVDPARQVAETASGIELPYDALFLAPGARRRAALPGATLYRGSPDGPAVSGLLAQLESGSIRTLVFAVPSGCTWTLPLYELALMTAAGLFERRIGGRRLVLVTPEEQPLAVFGRRASHGVAALLEHAGIEVHLGTHPVSMNGGLEVVPHGSIEADAVLALPRLEGPYLAGLPADDQGFIVVDDLLRVLDSGPVWAAGDATTMPVKQGGLAAQEAEVAAAGIAAWAGAGPEPRPFDPVLRATLMTGGEPRYLRAWIGGGHGDRSEYSEHPLWWPASKIAGRYIAPYLQARAGVGPVPAPR